MFQSNKVSCFSRLDRFPRAVALIAHYAGMVCIVTITLLIVVHVIGRYVFNKPILGQVELSLYLLITAVFLIIAHTQVVKGHTIIGIISDRYSKRTRAIVDIVTYVLCLALAIPACWQAVVQANYIKQSGQMSTVLHMPQFPVNYIVAVGWGLFSLVLLLQLVHSILTAVKEWTRLS